MHSNAAIAPIDLLLQRSLLLTHNEAWSTFSETQVIAWLDFSTLAVNYHFAQKGLKYYSPDSLCRFNANVLLSCRNTRTLTHSPPSPCQWQVLTCWVLMYAYPLICSSLITREGSWRAVISSSHCTNYTHITSDLKQNETFFFHIYIFGHLDYSDFT